MNFNVFKLNNYIKYYGKLKKHNNKTGIITLINRFNNEDSYEIILKDYSNTKIEIRAYKDEIHPIKITDQFLINNGFKFEYEGEIKLYKRNNIIIFSAIFIEKTNEFFPDSALWTSDTGLCGNDTGFRIIHDFILDYSNEIEVLEKTHSANSVNALQNYFEAILKIPIEIKW